MARIFKTHFITRILILICLLAVLPGGLALATPGETTLISVSSSGVEGNGMSRWPVISGDGNFVVFESYASNLVSDDTNGEPDIFVHDRQTGVTERVSVADDESQANNWSESDLAISRDGRYAVFASMASNLVPGDTNGVMDVFVRDRQLGTTERVSVNSNGEQTTANEWAAYGSLAISDDGRFVAFSSDVANLVSNDTNEEYDAFVHDRQTGATTRVSVSSSGEQGNTHSSMGDISGDGQLIVFSSLASNLVPNDTNESSDIFLHKLSTGETTRISLSPSGEQAERSSNNPEITENGRYVVFSSAADNLLPGEDIYESVYVRDLQTGALTRASVSSGGSILVGWAEEPTISADGRYVAFEYDDRGDSMPIRWIYIHDFLTGKTISATDCGSSEGDYEPRSPSFSADGRFLAFESGVPFLVDGDANGVVDVFVREDPTYDNPAPSVVSITRADTSPTGANSVRFSVTFSEAVSGVDAGDFILQTDGSLTGLSITNVSGAGTTYTVTVNTGTGSGNLQLELIADGSIVDDAFAPLADGYFDGEVYAIDKAAPRVTWIVGDDPYLAYTSSSVHYLVSFSKDVTGVDKADFKVTKTSSSTAAVTAVSGSGMLYRVTISTGSTKTKLRLDLVDNDTIRDVLNQPLGGTGTGNGNFTGRDTYTIVALTTSLFRSNGANDGWVLESGEDTGLGGSLNAAATTFYLGDNAQDRQFRAFLHFPTATLPDNAVIVSATLKLKKQSVTGTDPFTTHQNVLVDIQSGAFSANNALQIGDFEAPASSASIGMFANTPSNTWYSAPLDIAAFRYINLAGITQFRLAFQLDDNDDLSADTMQFYSGNYSNLAYRPQLEIKYYIP